MRNGDAETLTCVARAVPSGSRIMVDAVQTWTPHFWPAWLLHPPVRAAFPNHVCLLDG
jgi:hypothetical protein